MPNVRYVALLRPLLILSVSLSLAVLSAHAGTFTVFGLKNYVRGTGAPVTVTDTFSVLNPSTQYTLKAFNGGLENTKSELVSSSVVTINGVQVLGPSNFNQNVSEIDVPVTLQASNTISVQVRGQPGGTLTILIVGVDNQPPTITAKASPTPNASGWNNTNVTVTFSCSDAISGVASCPPSQTVTAEGANQVISGTATDNAGNMSTAIVKLNIDKTLPTISASSSPAPNGKGWNNSNVTVTFTCNDSLSGIANCTPPVTVSVDRANQTVSGTATDLAGNTASASLTVSLDKTPPAIKASASPVPNAAGWNNTNVTATFTCSDATSGVASCPPPQTVTTEAANQTVSGTATDNAGNASSAGLKLNIDKTPPTIRASVSPPPNEKGWNNSDVTVNFACTDSLSGVSNCPAPVTVSTEGSNQIISGSATDVAGNSTSASATVNLDKTPPALSITSPTNGATVPTPQITVTGSVSDSLSGLSVVTCNGAPANVQGGAFSCPLTLSVGANAITVQGVDVAGNKSTQSESVTLVQNLAPVVSAGSDQTITVPFDEFESNSINSFWTAFGPGTVRLSNTLAHSGTQSLLVTESASAPYYAWLRHDLGSQQFGSVSVYFHSGVVCCGSNSFLSIGNDGGAGAEEAGILQDSTGNYELFFAPPGMAVQSVSLGSLSLAGWHLLDIDAEPSGTTFKVDNSVVYSNPTSITFQYIFIGTEAGSGGGSAYFDDFRTSIASTSLSGTVSDDGSPVGFTISTLWAPGGGPGNVTFANPTLSFPDVAGVANPVSTTATFSAPGTYQLTLTASDSELTSSSTVNVTVNPPPPSLLTVSPSIVQSGQQSVSVTITGLFTSFAQGTSTASFGAGVSVVSLTVNSPESAVAVLNVDPAAAPGPRDVTVITGNEVATLPNGLMVTAPVIVPALITVSPNSGQQGQQNLSISITGQFTHFARGATTASF